MKKFLSARLLACALSGAVHAATIWQEDFSIYINAGITGQGTTNYPASITNWSIDVSACATLNPGSGNTNDYFMAVATSGGRMEAVNVDGEAVWSSAIINISGYTNVSLSVATSETGTSANTNKYVKLFYRLDGGAETAFAVNSASIGNWSSAAATQSNLYGASVQIIARVNNPNTGDKSIFDNVTVAGDPIPSGNTPPILNFIGNKSVTVSNALNFSVSATDADNDPIILSASNLPPGAVFNTVTHAGGATNSFSWASAAPVGVYTTTFYAVDGTTNDFESITITVTNNPAVPLTGAVWNAVYNLPQQSSSGTDYPDQFRIRNALLARINALQSGNSAVLSTFTFSAEDGAGAVINAMNAALDRGAAISFIADGGISLGTVYGGTNSLLDLSTRSTNPLTLMVDGSSSGIMHDKLGLFDYGGTNQWVFTASWNFTLAASANQWNIAVEARSPELYAIYTNETAEFLAGRFHDSSLKSHAHDGSAFTLDGSWGTNFVRFAPYPDPTQGGNNAERDITNLIAQAQSGIVFALNKLTREPIRDALVAAADRGVIIKGVMPRSDTDPGNVSDDIYGYLTNSANYATTNIVQMLPAYAKADYSALDSGESDLIHAKYMVIDPESSNAIVIHGSANWTYEALISNNDNDENTVFLRHNEIAAQFYENFLRITGAGLFAEGNSTIVEWNFNDSNQIADGGISANETQTVVRTPAPTSYTYTGDALSCSGWQSGSGTKYWETVFSTEQHTDVKVSSVQAASGTGPSDFQLQYKIGAAGTYADVSNAAVQVLDGGNGVLTRVSLPATCNNQSIVFLRWIMTSDIAARRYDNVQSGGRGSTDDIVITGTAYDQPPVLDPIGNQNVFEGETLAFSVTASDPVDFDTVTLSVSNLPSGASFTGGTFSWSNAAPSGVYTSTFYAVDKDGADNETVTITVLEKPLLMITEIADPDGTGGGNYRFVELYNAGSSTIDLSVGNWNLSQQANGNTWNDIPLTGSIAPAAAWVIAYSTTNFQNAYGFLPDQQDSGIDGTGDDSWFLYYDGDHTTGLLIDLYGAFDTDGSGETWEYTDSRAVRNANASGPNTTWTASEWDITSGATTNDMNPGEAYNVPPVLDPIGNRLVLEGQRLSFAVTASDPADGDAVTLNATNLPTGAVFTNGLFSWNAAVPVGAYAVTFYATDKDGSDSETVIINVSPLPQLFISEIADPAGTGGDAHRFVELYNAGTNAINLASNSWTLCRQNNGEDWTDIPLTGIVAAASTCVIAKGTNFYMAYGFNPQQISPGVDGNGNDVYALYCGGGHTNGTLIDIYGQTDADGTGTAWEYTDSRAARNNSILQPNNIWTASEWLLTPNAATGNMTPGQHGPLPEFQGLENPFVFLGDSLSMMITAVNTVRTDVIRLSAASLPAGATFTAAAGTDHVSGTLSWNSPTAGVYTASFAAAGFAGTNTASITITVTNRARIAGKFYGWSGGTIFKLENGQFWKQSAAGTKTFPAMNRPYVTITNVFGQRRLYLSNDYTRVALLPVIESTVTSSFAGLHYQTIYQLADGTVWKQISFENIFSNASSVTAWRWMEDGRQTMRFLDRNDKVIDTCTVEASAPPADTTVHSKIDGWFRGWQSKRVFVLKNGEFWQQTSLENSTDALYSPNVTITNWLQAGFWRMSLDGQSGYISVRQLTNITRTAVDRWFYGFGRDNIFPLADGSWWKQTSSENSASTRFNPEILIWSENGTDYLEMPDEGRAVTAEQLEVQLESTVTNSFAGLHYGNLYRLDGAGDWIQLSFENISTNVSAPTVMLWKDGTQTDMIVRDSRDITIGTCVVASPSAAAVVSARSLRPPAPAPSGNVLRWNAIQGCTYTIEWAPSLTESFQPLENSIMWPQNSWTDTVHSVETKGFYRITVRLTD